MSSDSLGRTDRSPGGVALPEGRKPWDTCSFVGPDGKTRSKVLAATWQEFLSQALDRLRRGWRVAARDEVRMETREETP